MYIFKRKKFSDGIHEAVKGNEIILRRVQNVLKLNI